MKRAAVGMVALALAASVAMASGQDKKEKKDKERDQLSELSCVVLKNDNGKPVRNASVVLHPVSKNGKQEAGGLQLKTDAEGKASYSGVPFGKLRIQVIAPGFQTYGEDYDINQSTQEITIKLHRPKEQYSIYK